MSPRNQPEQQAPPVQRLRLQYAKRGRARFASHRDFTRAFERALRRAGVEMAYSSGFSPHPRISYANAAPTGAATEAEYLELGLAREVEPEWVLAQLNAALPDGMVIVKAVPAGPGSLAERLTASRWQVDLPGADPAEVAAAVADLLAAAEVRVQRMTKNGLRDFDVRAAVLTLDVRPGGIELVSAVGEPLVRPDDVVRALQTLRPALRNGTPALVNRLEQGTWDGTRIADPLVT